MTIVTTRFASYVAALDDPTVLDVSLEWVSNGDRGFIHSIVRCQRLSKQANLIKHQLTILEASKRRACEWCFDQGVSQAVPRLRELQHLIHASTQLMQFRAQMEKATSIAEVYAVMMRLNHTKVQVNSVHGPAQEVGFVALYDQTKAEIVAVELMVNEKLSIFREQVITLTAAQILSNEYRRDLPESYVSKSESQLLIGNERTFGSNPLERLYSTWHGNLTNGNTDSITEVVASFELRSPTQLEGLSFGGTTDNLAQAVTQRWRDEVVITSDRLIDRWNSRFAKLIIQSEPELLAVQTRRLPSSELTQFILASYTLASQDEQSLAFLRVPKLVAKWLENQTKDDNRSQNGTKPVYRLGQCDYDNNTIDTAVRLWDLASDTYRHPEACILAAAALSR